MERAILIGVAGALGAVSRYGVAAAVSALIDPSSLSSFLVNIVGTFVLAVIATAGVEKFGLSLDLRPVVTVGFLGAFTTFSTLMVESTALAEDGRVWESTAWLAAGIVLGLGVAAVGMAVGRDL